MKPAGAVRAEGPGWEGRRPAEAAAQGTDRENGARRKQGRRGGTEALGMENGEGSM